MNVFNNTTIHDLRPTRGWTVSFPRPPHKGKTKKPMPQLIGGSKVRLNWMPTVWHVPCKPSEDDCRERTGRSGEKWPYAESKIRESWSPGGYAWLGFLGMGGDDESAVM